MKLTINPIANKNESRFEIDITFLERCNNSDWKILTFSHVVKVTFFLSEEFAEEKTKGVVFALIACKKFRPSVIGNRNVLMLLHEYAVFFGINIDKNLNPHNLKIYDPAYTHARAIENIKIRFFDLYNKEYKVKVTLTKEQIDRLEEIEYYRNSLIK